MPKRITVRLIPKANFANKDHLAVNILIHAVFNFPQPVIKSITGDNKFIYEKVVKYFSSVVILMHPKEEILDFTNPDEDDAMTGEKNEEN